MSLVTLVRHRLRAARIARAEQDLAAAREQADRYLAGQAASLNALRQKHDARNSQEIVRDIERSAKAGIFV